MLSECVECRDVLVDNVSAWFDVHSVVDGHGVIDVHDGRAGLGVHEVDEVND